MQTIEKVKTAIKADYDDETVWLNKQTHTKVTNNWITSSFEGEVPVTKA